MNTAAIPKDAAEMHMQRSQLAVSSSPFQGEPGITSANLRISESLYLSTGTDM